MKMSRDERAARKKRIRERIQIKMEQENYEFFPGEDEPDFRDLQDQPKRVAVYVRVSTDDEKQTTSFELQRKYYEEFVVKHPQWTLVKVYADEGVSGTTDKHRIGFQDMIRDVENGKIDLIITKSISRLSRDNELLLHTVRKLAELEPPVGIFFETEGIYSLKEDSEMALSFQGTMAQEESHAKSRSMETSLKMRLDHGLPLTPELLGYKIGDTGKLVINPDTAHIPKLMFYMYLYGYSSQEIADTLTALQQKTYRGNATWSANSVINTLRNERYCGDVYTRKTYTKSWRTHKKAKNRGKRNISHYLDEHDAIVSRDDYLAVQHMIDNAKYGNKSILPELRVIEDGLLKGFVVINPRWGGFTSREYIDACVSVYQNNQELSEQAEEIQIKVQPGEFDFRGYEVCDSSLFETQNLPHVSFSDKKVKFGIECIRKIKEEYVELLIHPLKRQFAVRPSVKTNRNAVVWSKTVNGEKQPKDISAGAFYPTVCELFDFSDNTARYRVRGELFQSEDETAYIFNVGDHAIAFIKTENIEHYAAIHEESIKPINVLGTRVKAIPKRLVNSFGHQYYVDDNFVRVYEQSKEDWQIRLEGQLFDTGDRLKVTDYNTLRTFIMDQLSEYKPQEVIQNGEQ